MAISDLPRVELTSETAPWDWLGANHAGGSVWFVTWKAAHRDRYLSREQVLDALIAHGWIDGRRMKLDANRTMQLVSPRAQGRWARSYRARAERLIAEGRMRPSGQAAVDAARRDGTWEVRNGVDDLVVPEDLRAALTRHGGGDWFDASALSYRRNVLRCLASAKRAETRARRIGMIADHAARGEKVPHY